MRPSRSSQTYVCLPCLLKSAQYTTLTPLSTHDPIIHTTRRNISLVASRTRQPVNKDDRGDDLHQIPGTQSRCLSSNADTTRLSQSQRSRLGQLNGLRERLQDGLSAASKSNTDLSGVPIEKVLASSNRPLSNAQSPLLQTIEQAYAGEPVKNIAEDIAKVNKYLKGSEKTEPKSNYIAILNKLGILETHADKKQKTGSVLEKTTQAPDTAAPASETRATCAGKETSWDKKKAVRKHTTSTTKSTSISPEDAPSQPTLGERKRRAPRVKRVKIDTPPAWDWVIDGGAPELPALKIRRGDPRTDGLSTPLAAPPDAKSLNGKLIPLEAIENETLPAVPRLSFDLSRVLFNPGVYQLRDPRSRVYNFDPYLEHIMPVSEFNFDALNPYITSSEDTFLRDVSLKHGKKYIGSSSSMSSAMSHFHFLLSAWRPIDTSMLSQKISGMKTFTQITRSPSSIFLRWRNGVYAIDADKEHDTPNVLMMQGKSMEKLLTLEKDEFEKYRKTKSGEQAPAIDSDPEQYHYSAIESFLLRSQLDAYDPRLPGTGMFDLKTRAVAGIRMIMTEPEVGMNYQIKDRFGMWESFDREYFDMIRSAFLKYSLQVRFGRMDGIFVAYHNIARIFGFQYVSLPELDMALHGQADPAVGNEEFRLTLRLMNEIFDQATSQFPEQSMKIMFETREQMKSEPNGVMRIFVEPMTEEEINKIQATGKEKTAVYERRITAGEPLTQKMQSEPSEEGSDEKMSASTLESSAADDAFLDELLNEEGLGKEAPDSAADTDEKTIAAWDLRIFNRVNGQQVVRPTEITAKDEWVVKYKLEQQFNQQRNMLAYSQSRTRRSAALGHDIEAKKYSPFVEKLRTMSEDGKLWREQQDELDAQREKITLYNLGQ